MFSVNCADPFIPIPLDPGTECVSFDENGPKCSKIERCSKYQLNGFYLQALTRLFSVNGTKRYIRRCRDDNHDMAGDEIHYCSSDFCNSAIKNGPITVTATIATSIVMMLVALKLF